MKYIKVRVRYFIPYFKKLIGVDEETIEIEVGSTVKDIIVKLSEIHGKEILVYMLDDDKKDLRENVLVMINDVVVPNAKYVVKDGETITFLIAVDGG